MIKSTIEVKLNEFKIQEDEEMVDDNENDDDDDDEVICLDDPYEQLDSKPKKSPKKLIQEANKVVLSNRFDQDLNVSPVSLSKLNQKSEPMNIDLNIDDKLRNAAIRNGFNKDEIDHAFKFLPVDHRKLMNEQQFLNYLIFNKNINVCSIDSSQYGFKKPSSVKINSPINIDDDDDVKIIDDPNRKIEPQIVFQEYAQMVNKQGFDNKFKELENKEVRMKTLTLGMSDAEQQMQALSKIKALKNKNDASPPPIKFNMAQNVVPTPISNHTYNPKLYETTEKSILFTDFDSDNKGKNINKRPLSKPDNPKIRSNSTNPYSRDSSTKQVNNDDKNVPQYVKK
jgi:hypothetical protein